MVLKKQSSLSSNCIPSMKAQVVLREPEIGYFMSIIPQLKKKRVQRAMTNTENTLFQHYITTYISLIIFV